MSGENTEELPKRPVSPVNGQPVPLGRPKGVPNKATINGRRAIADFVDGNADRLAGWLDQVAETKPEEAFKLFMSVVEYHIPKLNRTEMQPLDENGEKSSGFILKIEHVKAPERQDT